MPRKLIEAEKATAAAMEAIVDTFIERKWTDADGFRFKAMIAVAVALDAIPAAEPKTLLDPDEVKAVLAEVLASQPMAKVWAEAAINAMCGKVVGDAAAEGGGEG
jgi:hypothetical protein